MRIERDMIGRTISRYRVLERLGAGGMGEVYRAHDERLGRDVALKILRGVRGGRLDRDRIRTEARTLSRLNHPGISTVFDVESSDGLEFLVLELVAGETLDEVLKRGPLPEPRVRDYGAQIADALAAAHEQGITHRDLKPANVMISPRGRVKILDFGLALHAGPSAAAETQDGAEGDLVVGTLAYMSPEQMLGRPVDGRSDLYSLGVVLYEMATGRRPFDAPLATALINDVLNAPPPPPRESAPALSEALSCLVLALLEKDPARRPATASDAAGALRDESPDPRDRAARDAAGRADRAIGSIAVLPLTNLSRDEEQEFFADGMTEALILNLTRIRSLRVVSRTSAMQFKGARTAIREIARSLGVDAVVEGAVTRSGSRVRITAQLIDARDDSHLWAQSYERDLRDVLALQSEVARAIAEEIRAKILPHEEARFWPARRVDPEAYEEYLRGRFHWNRRSEDGARKAIEAFERSIAKDPDYAPAYAGLADAYNTLAIYNFLPPHESFPHAEAAVTRALALDESLAEAHVSLGSLRFNAHWDWGGSAAAFRRAIALDPNLASAHHWNADLLSALARADEAVAEARLAQALDPLSLIVNTSVGLRLMYARRPAEAIAHLTRTLELDPTFAPALRTLGGSYELAGRYAEAIATFRRAVEHYPDELSARALLAHAHAAAGEGAEARRLLAELESLAATRYVAAYPLAAIHVGLGEHERAMARLEEAYRRRDRSMVWLKVAPRFDPLRGHAEFRDLIRRLRLDDDSIRAAGL